MGIRDSRYSPGFNRYCVFPILEGKDSRGKPIGLVSDSFSVYFSAIANECDVLLSAHIRALQKQVTNHDTMGENYGG